MGTQERVENIWMNDQIRNGMKKRREINRRRRNATNDEVKERLWREYQRQKHMVQRLIREARERHEIELTKEIRKCRRNNSQRKILLEGKKKKLSNRIKDMKKQLVEL